MKPTLKQSSNAQSIDRKVLLLLQRNGALTIEGLTRLTGISWGPVYKSVERLGQTGRVSMAPVYPSEYLVSVSGGREPRVIKPHAHPV